MGELIDLQAYKEKKEVEELRQLQEELEELAIEISPEPYWPSEEYLFPVENLGLLSPYHYSIDHNEIEFYYHYDVMFSDETLLEFWNGIIDETKNVNERPGSEIEPDGS